MLPMNIKLSEVSISAMKIGSDYILVNIYIFDISNRYYEVFSETGKSRCIWRHFYLYSISLGRSPVYPSELWNTHTHSLFQDSGMERILICWYLIKIGTFLLYVVNELSFNNSKRIFFLLLWILPYHLDKSVVQNLTLHHGNEIST